MCSLERTERWEWEEVFKSISISIENKYIKWLYFYFFSNIHFNHLSTYASSSITGKCLILEFEKTAGTQKYPLKKKKKWRRSIFGKIKCVKEIIGKITSIREQLFFCCCFVFCILRETPSGKCSYSEYSLTEMFISHLEIGKCTEYQ